MEKQKPWLFAALLGVVSALLLLFSAAHTLRSLGELVFSAAGLLGLSAENAEMLAQIAGQTQDAVLRLPGLSVTLICLLAAGLTVKIAQKRKKRSLHAEGAFLFDLMIFYAAGASFLLSIARIASKMPTVRTMPTSRLTTALRTRPATM